MCGATLGSLIARSSIICSWRLHCAAFSPRSERITTTTPDSATRWKPISARRRACRSRASWPSSFSGRPESAISRSRTRCAVTWHQWLMPTDGCRSQPGKIFDYPRAAHWIAPPFEGDSPNPTAGLVGMLLHQGAESEWLSRATEWCWRRFERALEDAQEIACALGFLQHAPGRGRAREVALRVAREADQTLVSQVSRSHSLRRDAADSMSHS